jgi:hypothetical protein
MRVWDRGWLFAIGWVGVVPYYLIRTRGLRKGIVTLLAWPAVYFLVVAAIAGFAVVISD